MKYCLVSKLSTARKGYVQFERHGSGLESFLCELRFSISEVENLLKLMVKNSTFGHLKKLGFIDHFFAKYLHGAREINYVGQLGEGKKTGYIEFYQGVNRTRQRFFILRTRNASPYREESGGFSYDSVVSALENAKEIIGLAKVQKGGSK